MTSVISRPGLDGIGHYMVGISKLPGFERVIKLSSNESALGMSPAAQAAAAEALRDAHIYPEVDMERLEEAIAARFALKPGRIAFGPGSDELLTRLIMSYAGPGDELVYSEHAYMQFPIYAKRAGATPVAAKDEGFRHSIDRLLAAATERTRVVIIANPDNPSGTHLSAAEVRRLRAGLPKEVLLIVDAAYDEYADAPDYESAAALVESQDNVVMTRTFSKVFGMAGLRLGWCYGPLNLIDLMVRIGPSFPLNVVANAAGLAAIEDQAHTEEVLNQCRRARGEFTRALTEIGLKVLPSQTNFVLVTFPENSGKSAEAADAYLNAQGIIPRRFAIADFADKLRFTIGRDEEMEKTAAVLKEFMAP